MEVKHKLFGRVISSLTVIVLIRERCMKKFRNKKERCRHGKLTVVHPDCVAIVRANISYVTVTPIAELLAWN
jgi:hypothetical protein